MTRATRSGVARVASAGVGLAATCAALAACQRPSPSPSLAASDAAAAAPRPARSDAAGAADARAAAADAAPAVPAGPTATVEAVVYLEGPIRAPRPLTVPNAWRANRGCRDAALRYTQPFDVVQPGPFPGALVAVEAREQSPAPVRERRLVVRDCDITPRVLFATTRDRVVFHSDTQEHHLIHVRGTGATIDRVLIPGQPDLPQNFPGPGRYPVNIRTLPEWAGALVFVLPNRFIETTDVAGRARITDVPVGEGRALVHAWYPGTVEAREVVALRPNETTRVEFRLRQAPEAVVRDAGADVYVPQ